METVYVALAAVSATATLQVLHATFHSAKTGAPAMANVLMIFLFANAKMGGMVLGVLINGAKVDVEVIMVRVIVQAWYINFLSAIVSQNGVVQTAKHSVQIFAMGMEHVGTTKREHQTVNAHQAMQEIHVLKNVLVNVRDTANVKLR